ncbi:transcriptional regulator [Polaromonas jejuensis]|uniref:Transcriptional regulator n=1 Tax=Polaromonas jejuensis TaxID=457502 RepID=A0ABW0QHF7_9BURK
MKYLSGLSPDERESFALRCGTSVGYLRKACSIGQRLGESLCINIERESHGAVPCEALRPDVDWAYLRNSRPELAGAQAPEQKQPEALDVRAPIAINPIAAAPQAEDARGLSCHA